MAILLFFVSHWYLSLFCQTFFLHRYGSHRMFRLSPFAERFFYLLTFISQGPSFLVPRAYAVLHRMHHAFSDTERDPHSPHFFTDPLRMMWRTKLVYAGLVERTITPMPELAANTPEWESLDRFGDSMYTRTLWAALYFCFYCRFAASAWLFALLPVHFVMGVLHGAIVNWCGHRYGYRNFAIRDKSRNTLPVDFLMMGELYQNNHHAYPSRPHFAVRRFEVDPAYPVIVALRRFGIIRPLGTRLDVRSDKQKEKYEIGNRRRRIDWRNPSLAEKHGGDHDETDLFDETWKHQRPESRGIRSDGQKSQLPGHRDRKEAIEKLRIRRRWKIVTSRDID
jgi:stearoyl-CoA desaturase (delta-9 desaturase)